MQCGFPRDSTGGCGDCHRITSGRRRNSGRSRCNVQRRTLDRSSVRIVRRYRETVSCGRCQASQGITSIGGRGNEIAPTINGISCYSAVRACAGCRPAKGRAGVGGGRCRQPRWRAGSGQTGTSAALDSGAASTPGNGKRTHRKYPKQHQERQIISPRAFGTKAESQQCQSREGEQERVELFSSVRRLMRRA